MRRTRRDLSKEVIVIGFGFPSGRGRRAVRAAQRQEHSSQRDIPNERESNQTEVRR
jgi:hypothetical protein